MIQFNRVHALAAALGLAAFTLAGAQAPHPVTPAAPPVAQQTEGKVNVDPAAKFTHFRVGNKNVKSIMDVMSISVSSTIFRRFKAIPLQSATDSTSLRPSRPASPGRIRSTAMPSHP